MHPLDRGIASQKNLDFLRERDQSFLVGTPRSRLGEFDEELCTRDWRHVRPPVEVKSVERDGQTYVLARSVHRRAKEKAIRKRVRVQPTAMQRVVRSGVARPYHPPDSTVGRIARRSTRCR